jgi:hypothetical protein
MKNLKKNIVIGVAFTLICACILSNAQPKVVTKTNLTRLQQDYPVKPVPFNTVHVNDTFWAPRIEINRTVTIPFAFQKCEETGRMDNFLRAAAALRSFVLKAEEYVLYYSASLGNGNSHGRDAKR